MDELYEYIQAILSKDTYNNERFRINMDSFVSLWQKAVEEK